MRRQLAAILVLFVLVTVASSCTVERDSSMETPNSPEPSKDVAGIWQVTLSSTSGGRMVPGIILILDQDNNLIEGTWRNPRAPAVRAVEGRVVGRQVSFSFSFKEQGEDRLVEVTAAAEDDDLKGIADFKNSEGRVLASFQLIGYHVGDYLTGELHQRAERKKRATPVTPQQAETLLQTELNRLQKEEGFPGAVAAVVIGDQSAIVVATGFADREAKIAMPADALMPAGSVGKTFVAALVLDLVADGLMHLDDPISVWLRNETWFERLPNSSDITVRMLLNHSSGLPDHVDDRDFVTDVRAHSQTSDHDHSFIFSPSKLIGYVLDEAPFFPAGHGYHYSDTGYILLGLIIEKAAGESYYQLLRSRFLEPLELPNTHPANRRDISGVVPGYLPEDNALGLPTKTVLNNELVFDPSSEWTGGGVISNVADLARWASLLYQGEAMVHPYLEEMLSSSSEDNSNYGLGVSISETRMGVAYGHAGQFPGYRTSIAYYPEQQLAIAVQVNTDVGADTGRYITRLVEALVFQP